MYDCKNCRYHYWLVHDFDIHVDAIDCDQVGTDFCQTMNDPEFIKFMKERDSDESNS
jgi:hypothetical protein